MITEKRIGELIKNKGLVYYVDIYTNSVYKARPTGILYTRVPSMSTSPGSRYREPIPFC